jgi:acetyl-CoA acetyltransferase
VNNEKHSSEAVILSAVRTPSGKFQGSLSSIPAPRLGALVVRAAVDRAGLPDPTQIDEVIMGQRSLSRFRAEPGSPGSHLCRFA